MTEHTEKAESQTPEQEAERSADALTSDELEQIQSSVVEASFEPPTGAEDIVAAFRATLAQRDDWQNRFVQLSADFQNFQRRAANNEREARQGATAGVVQSVMPILDQFDLALEHAASGTTAEQIASGVTLIRDEFQRILGTYGVSKIEPKPGDEFNPSEHEAMLQSPSEEVKPGCVVQSVGAGYRLGERVIRPAKVIIAQAADA